MDRKSWNKNKFDTCILKKAIILLFRCCSFDATTKQEYAVTTSKIYIWSGMKITCSCVYSSGAIATSNLLIIAYIVKMIICGIFTWLYTFSLESLTPNFMCEATLIWSYWNSQTQLADLSFWLPFNTKLHLNNTLLKINILCISMNCKSEPFSSPVKSVLMPSFLEVFCRSSSSWSFSFFIWNINSHQN